MAKRKRTDHRRDPRRPTIVRRHDARPSGGEDDDPFIRTLTHTLYDGHPTLFLDRMSMIISATEHRPDPYREDTAGEVTLGQVVETFEGHEVAAATAALHVIAAMTTDEVLAARLRGVLATRQQRPKVEEILLLCDDNADSLLDIEHRTANRRLLRDLVLANPEFFRGRAAARTSAAAICYLVAHANSTLSFYGPLTAKALLAPFGTASAGQRVHQFRQFLGLPTYPEQQRAMELGTPDYLVGIRRGALITERDRPAAD